MVPAQHFPIRLMAALAVATVALVHAAGGSWGLPLPGAGVTLLWPLAGIAFAALWVFRRPAVFWVILGTFLVDYGVNGSLGFSLPAAAGTGLSALAACLVLRRLGVEDPFRDPDALLKFLGIAVLSAPLLSTLAGLSGLWLDGLPPADHRLATALTWWAADATGVMTVAPVLLAFRSRRYSALPGRSLPEIALLAAAFGLLVQALPVSSPEPAAGTLSFALPLLVWAALRFPLAVVALLLVALSALAIRATAPGLDSFAGPDSPWALARLHLFLFTAAGAGSLLSVTVQALRRARKHENAHAERLAVTLRSIGDGLIATDAEGRVTLLNAAAERITGWRQKEAVQRPIGEVFRIIDGRTGAPAELPVVRTLATGTVQELAEPAILLARDGARRFVADSAAPIRDERGAVSGAVLVFRDVTARRKAEARLAGQARILAKITTEARLEDLLEDLARFVDELEPGLRCTVLLADHEAGVLRHGAGLGMPESYNRRVDGLPIREGLGSCGTAAARGEPVIVADVMADPLWRDFHDIARTYGIGACWSFPVHSGEGELLGTFALYHGEPRRPGPEQLDLLRDTVSLAAMVIERHRDARRLKDNIADKQRSLEQLRQSRDRLARQQASLLALMDNEIFFLAEPERALDLLTEVAARTLEVQRVNTWRTTGNGKTLRCIAEFDAGGRRGTVGMELPMETCPAYLDTVTRLEAVIADDVRAHPATPELLKPYIKPLRIGAMLDVPVRLFGRFSGVLCFEHVGAARRWSEEERFFALSLANLVSLIYEHWERGRAEAALRASELSLRETLHNAPNVAVQRYDAEARLLYWNPASEKLYGWSAREALGRTPDEFMLDPEQAAIFRAALAEVRDTGKPVGPMEYLARHRDGSPLVMLSTLFAIPGTTGQSRHIVCMDVDMTDRKRTEAALRYRDRILEMVAFATGRLLSAADWTDEMRAVLAHLGLAADVDRVYVYENREEADEIWSYQRFEWVEPGLPQDACNPALQTLPLYEAGFGRWVETLRGGGIVAGPLREFPEEERQLLAAGHIQSMALAPIFARDRWWGFIGFSVSRAERHWSAVELDALKAVANNLGGAIGRQEAEASLRLAATAFETSEGIMITDARGTILRVNQALCALTGYTAEELVGDTPALLRSDRHDTGFYREIWNQLRDQRHWEGELWNRRKDGLIAPHWASIKPVLEGSRAISHYVATFLDISERKRAEQEIAQLAYYDALTGLPNRRLLVDRLQHALATSRREGHHGALMFVDLDHFKHLNDALGHLMGDLLLKQVAERMAGLVRRNDTIGRLGGDEFVVLLEGLSANPAAAASEARRVAEKLVAALNRPFALGEYEHHVSASFGVALFPDAGSTAEDILKRADTAMYRSKAGGRNTLRFFEPAMQAAAETRLTLEKALRDAIARNELTLYLQPQVDNHGGFAAVEALVRWARPGSGLMAPGDFMTVAEESGLIVPLGEWVLEAGCRIIATHTETDRLRGLSVNISPREFRHAEFAERVRSVLERTRADPARLTLELTENAVIEDIEDTIRKMTTLGQLGIRFSIDDFGTGHSSLAYLKQLPVSEIKIDRGFVADVISDPNDAAIVDAILAMGERLGLKVVAEGVETEEQARFLRERGCRFFQGYLYSPPLPVEEYLEYPREPNEGDE